MKKKASLMAIIGLFACLVLAGTPSSRASQTEGAVGVAKKTRPASKVRWVPYEEGLRRSRDEGKKVFLSFYADWCHYCKEMEEKTFQDNAVAAYLNDHYIPIQIDSDRQQKIAREYKVQGLPTTYFLAADGGSIGSQPGYIPPDLMLPLLQFIHTDSFKTMDFQKFQEGR